MPVFHTKIIESILEPVAQQVSRLVILHEEAEDGNAMPDLARPVQAVSAAVNNLVKVGHETIESSDDQLLRHDMPSALKRVESAAALLQDASDMLRADPYSGPARKKLIEGSRGILQGTSALLLCFDESEVRKIVRECKKVLDYLSVAEVIDTMEDLVQFLKDVSPALSRCAREVGARAQDLTHKPHAEILERCLEQVKSLAPVLICSMKIYIHIMNEGGKGIEEASENRNYLAQRMADEIHEIIRVLQLTSYDGDGGEGEESAAALRAIVEQLPSKLSAANQWIDDPQGLRGAPGERALRWILTASRSAGPSAQRLCPRLSSDADSLCAARSRGQDAPATHGRLRSGINEIARLINEAARDADRLGASTAAAEMQARLEQAHKWLLHPSGDPATRLEGQKAINAIVARGQKIANGLQGREKAEVLQLCSEVQRLSSQLGDLCSQGLGDTPEARELTKKLSDKLHELKAALEKAVVNRVVEDFIDVAAPLRHFTDAVNVPEGTIGREQNFAEKANQLQNFSDRANQTAQIVALGGSAANKRLAEELLTNASQVEKLSPQLISAGRIRLNYPSSKIAEEHFNNLRQQYADSVLRVRDLCDQAVNPLDFVRTATELMQKHTYLCEEAIRQGDSQKMVDNTSAVARLANRVLLVAAQERENTEDAEWARTLGAAHRALQAALPPTVQRAKAVAIGEPNAAQPWREANAQLLARAADVESAFASRSGDPSAELSRVRISDVGASPPPRPPPPPAAFQQQAPPRPPPPSDTDDEGEAVFSRQPHPSQPIMVAAHNLHRAVRHWSSKDNEIIAAAKKMAVLMARLSELVRSDSKGSKRELIATAKAIAEASEEVTRLAKKLALECTDKRIRTNLLQVCERIPTIGTQLKILSTVKATMLGAQGSEEDQEATEMLVGNAQNLMQSVKETVKAAEGASIKIRTDQGGYQLRWVRRSPWYQI